MVEEQERAAHMVSEQADAAYEHAASGLSHLQQHYYAAARNDRTFAAVTAAVVVLTMVVAYCWAYADADAQDSSSGLPQNPP